MKCSSTAASRDLALVEVVAAVAAHGHLARAEVLARCLDDDDQRSRALVAVIRTDEALAESLLDAIPEPRWQARALTQLVARGYAGRCTDAETAINAITYTRQRAQALAELASAVASIGDVKHATALARSINVPEWRIRALRRLAEIVAGVGDFERARGLADMIADPAQRASALAYVATRCGGIEARRLVTYLLHTQRWTAALAALATLSPGVVRTIGADLLAEAGPSVALA